MSDEQASAQRSESEAIMSERAEATALGLPEAAKKFVRAATGEGELWIAIKSNPNILEGWVTVLQASLISMAQDADLTVRDFRVALALLAFLDFDNWVQVPQSRIAELLKLDPADVSRCLGHLRDRDFIYRGPRLGGAWTWRLNPGFAWKGKHRQLRGAQASFGRELTKAKAQEQQRANTRAQRRRSRLQVIEGGSSSESPETTDFRTSQYER